MDPNLLKKLNAARHARRAALLLTDLSNGRDRLIGEGDVVAGELGALVAKSFRSGKSAAVEAGGRPFFLNVHVPPPRLVVLGAVQISQALAPMADLVGIEMEIIDPRACFATPERFPGVLLRAEPPQGALAKRPLDAYTAVAALSHDPEIDDPALKSALDAGCFYVGALGSRRTHARRLERLAGIGVTETALARIHAPIGLDIAAATPAEIAVAVLAQIIGTLRSRPIGDASSETGA